MSLLQELEQKISAKTKEIQEFRDAISMIKGNASYTPVPDSGNSTERLAAMMSNARSSADRQQNIATAEAALGLATDEMKELQLSKDRLIKSEERRKANEDFAAAAKAFNQNIEALKNSWNECRRIKSKHPHVCPQLPVYELTQAIKIRTHLPKMTPNPGAPGSWNIVEAKQ